MKNTIFLLIIAVCFSIWPILLNKSANPNMALGAIIVMFVSSITMLAYHVIMSYIDATVKLDMPTKYLLMAIGIGIINGIGMILYSRLINTPDPALYVSIIAVLMPIGAMFLGYWIIGEPTITLTKIVGVVGAVVCIWLITSKDDIIKDLLQKLFS
jgi:hypothetical protein